MYRVLGMVYVNDIWVPMAWRTDGVGQDTRYNLKECELDIEVWANVYENGTYQIFRTEDLADLNNRGRVERIKLSNWKEDINE